MTSFISYLAQYKLVGTYFIFSLKFNLTGVCLDLQFSTFCYCVLFLPKLNSKFS